MKPTLNPLPVVLTPLVLSLICHVTPTIVTAHSGQAAVSSGYVEIDGAKTPEQIPEYLVWSTGFDSIALLKEKGWTNQDPLGQLTSQLIETDIEMVYSEVARHTHRREECHATGRRISESMKALEVEQIEAAMKQNTLQCRQALLDAKDQLLSRMTPEGAAALTIWMMNERRKVRSLIRKEDLVFYRLPRYQ